MVDYALVDAFTDVAFKGNPAAVCLLPSFGDEKWMQNVAAEFSVPMTAFLFKREASGNYENGISEDANANGATKPGEKASHYDIRWFTIQKGCPLCGHATKLASAYLLFKSGQAPGSTIYFHTTSSGLMSARKVFGEGKGNADEVWHGVVELCFLSLEVTPYTLKNTLASLPRTLKGSTVIASFKVEFANYLLLELGSAEEVATHETNTEELMQCDARGCS